MSYITTVNAVYLSEHLHIVGTKNEHIVNLDMLEMAYKFTTVKFNYYDVVNVMSKLPKSAREEKQIYTRH